LLGDAQGALEQGHGEIGAAAGAGVSVAERDENVGDGWGVAPHGGLRGGERAHQRGHAGGVVADV